MRISESELITGAEQQLRSLLSLLPWAIESEAPNHKSTATNQGVDLVIHLGEGDQRRTIVCEVKSNGQPRNVRNAALQLQAYARQFNPTDRIYPVVVAPFISKDSGSAMRILPAIATWHLTMCTLKRASQRTLFG